jgi:hypothetical protein
MEMTIVEWLNLLDEPYKTQALLNSRAERRTRMVSTISDAINQAFTWSETPQGREYWSDLFNDFELKEETANGIEFRKKQEADLIRARDEHNRIQLEKVLFSSSMQEMLEKLAPDSLVANYLTCARYTINTFGNYVTTRQGMLSFLPNGREHKVNPETGKWLRDGRQEMKPAKLARKLIRESQLADLSDADFEKFGNKVRAYLGVVGDEDGEGKNIRLEIIEGNAIKDAYLHENYSTILGDGTNLHGSCMRSACSQRYFGIYTENPSAVKMLVARDEDNKVLGRALLWQFDDGEKGMDTVYGPDIVAQLMIDWAMDNGYWHKTNQSCHHHNFDGHGLDRHSTNELRDMGKIIRKVTLNKAEFDYYPYVDSLYHLCNDGKWYLSNVHDSYVEKTLRDTGGSYEEYNDDDDDDDYVTLESGDRVHQDDACYVDYRNYEGSRIDGYYLDSDCIYCLDGETRLREDCVRVDGDWYGLDDDEIAYVEDHSEYFLASDTVYCAQRELTIHRDDAVELHDGDYCDSEYAHDCVIDGLIYKDSDMDCIEGVWVALDNKETYLEQLKEKQNETEREGTTA